MRSETVRLIRQLSLSAAIRFPAAKCQAVSPVAPQSSPPAHAGATTMIQSPAFLPFLDYIMLIDLDIELVTDILLVNMCSARIQ